ncbi:MAG TPA: diacylglycerol kinase family protein [Clostridia bacterium]|nr:diacylglycerol kinase family protein [Clostridia bacterium]
MKKHGLGTSFAHAFDGILAVLKKERSMRIHLLIALLVAACGFLFRISTSEWLVCLIFFALVMGAEAVNTSVEAICDRLSPEPDPKIKLAKDAAAGAVLICAVMAAIAGFVIFLPKVIALF